MDNIGKIYIAKPLRQAGLVNTIEILPNAQAAVIYQTGTRTEDILASLEIIKADLKHRQKTEAEAKRREGRDQT
jgi:hypothetical protein